MKEIKMMHCPDNRTEEQHVYVETRDGKFKYEVFMDYAKGLPEDLDMIPVNGNVAGGFCDAQDNLYCVLRGGGVGMNPGPKTCFVKLDPDGNYVEKIGEGKMGSVHFGNVTAENTILIATVMQQQILEMDMDGNIVNTIGEAFKNNGNKPHNLMLDPHYVRIHYGLYATEPIHYGGHGPYDQMLDFQNTQYCETPFHNPNSVDVDSKGNIYVCDGYGNYAIHKFDRQGRKIKTWGGKGVYDYTTDTPGKFVLPHSLCLDANDNVWVCDREKDAVHVFDNEGNVLAYRGQSVHRGGGRWQFGARHLDGLWHGNGCRRPWLACAGGGRPAAAAPV